MKRILVLGTGLVGSAIVKDLSARFEVLAADLDQERLDSLRSLPNVTVFRGDLTDPAVFKDLAAKADLVIGALPGFLGFQSVRNCIMSGKNMVDISFFPEDPFELDLLAREKEVTIVTDCGVAPGMSNMIMGYHHARMRLERFRCLVGGLPLIRTWPWQYRAVFSPVDVIEEYTRPARYIENNRLIVKEALSEPELVDFPEVGTLEAFNSDGLRSLIKTVPIPNMIEKTLRYPGTAELLRVLRDTGFFDQEPVEIDSHAIRPIDLTSKLLFPKWKLNPDERELTVMRINLEGEEDGRKVEYQWDLLDYTDTATGITSMARTTGFTCTAVANLLISQDLTQPGINPPELISSDETTFRFILKYLKDRGVQYHLIKQEKPD